MSDLVPALLKVIDKTEQRGRLGASPVGYFACDKTYLPSEVHTVYVEDALTERDAVQRRCAADRKIVMRHSPVILHAGGGADYFKTTRVCSSCEPNRQFPETSYPCPTILALAEGYGVEVDS